MKILIFGEIVEYCDVNFWMVIWWLESGKLKGFKLFGCGNNWVLINDFIDFLECYNMLILDNLKFEVLLFILIVDDELLVVKFI